MNMKKFSALIALLLGLLSNTPAMADNTNNPAILDGNPHRYTSTSYFNSEIFLDYLPAGACIGLDANQAVVQVVCGTGIVDTITGTAPITVTGPATDRVVGIDPNPTFGSVTLIGGSILANRCTRSDGGMTLHSADAECPTFSQNNVVQHGIMHIETFKQVGPIAPNGNLTYNFAPTTYADPPVCQVTADSSYSTGGLAAFITTDTFVTIHNGTNVPEGPNVTCIGYL
jgi:hypothetical protein